MTHDTIVVAPISHEIIAEACRRVGMRNPLRRDFNGRTVHAIVTGPDGSKAWLKISGIPLDTQDPGREAEIEADRQLGQPRPKVIATSAWDQDDRSWRAVLMQLAPSNAAGRHAWSVPSSSNIPESWFADLRSALRAVQLVRTSRFICTPTEFSDAIKAHLPAGVPTKADAWCVQHGDLHWSNLTLPHLTLLDWEVWGLAPVGYGAGRLLTFSLLAPEVAQKLEETFADEFFTPSGRVGLLAAIAVVKRQIEAGDVPNELEAPIQSLIDRILNGDFGKAHRLLDLATALKALPEPYQPIFGHPELSEPSLRPCEDRLDLIIPLCEGLKRSLGRPLRILDLGCAQGYLSLRLAESGNIVVGIDNTPANIAVCQALAREHPELTANFEIATVGDTLQSVEVGDYDVVLGLSVFHHICHAEGKEVAQAWLDGVSDKIAVGVFEFALPSEVANWAAALPRDVRHLVASFGNVVEVAQLLQPSRVLRPMYFCARDVRFLGRFAEERWPAGS